MKEISFSCRSEAYEASEDQAINTSAAETLGDIINARYSRRTVLKGALGVTALSALATSPLSLLAAAGKQAPSSDSRFGFTEVAHGVDETHHVAPGYSANVLNRTATTPPSPSAGTY